MTNLMATMLLGGLWHGAAWNFRAVGRAAWAVPGSLHASVAHAPGCGCARCPGAGPDDPVAVVVAWVPFRATTGLAATGTHAAHGMAGLGRVWRCRAGSSRRVPGLGLARQFRFQCCRILGDGRNFEPAGGHRLRWRSAGPSRSLAPHVHALSRTGARAWALTGSFALTVQALFFAPKRGAFPVFPVLSDAPPDVVWSRDTLPRVARDLYFGLFALGAGPAGVERIALSRQIETRLADGAPQSRQPEADNPGRLQRTLFAPLRNHRAYRRAALYQCWHRRRHWARLPVRSGGRRCCGRAMRCICRWSRPSTRVAGAAKTRSVADAAILFRQ